MSHLADDPAGAREEQAVTLGDIQLDALREVGNIGAGNAAQALSQLTGEPVPMGVPAVRILAVEEIPDVLGGEDEVIVAVFLGVAGDASGHMLFLLDVAAARQVCASMMGGMPVLHEDREGGPFGFAPIELSALEEVGNILTGSYLNAIATMTGLRLDLTPPAIGVDMGDALLTAALAEVALLSDTALLIETAFSGGEKAAVGQFVFIPTADALETVLAGLGLAS